jgi:DNA-binding FrmR family transcriptional regulator
VGTIPARPSEVKRFGKYKGEPISSPPSEYIEFLIQSATETIEDCRQELERRAQVEEANKSVAEKIVEAGYRELVKRHHPDLGSDGEMMRELNSAVAALREMVRHEDGD